MTCLDIDTCSVRGQVTIPAPQVNVTAVLALMDNARTNYLAARAGNCVGNIHDLQDAIAGAPPPAVTITICKGSVIQVNENDFGGAGNLNSQGIGLLIYSYGRSSITIVCEGYHSDGIPSVTEKPSDCVLRASSVSGGAPVSPPSTNVVFSENSNNGGVPFALIFKGITFADGIANDGTGGGLYYSGLPGDVVSLEGCRVVNNLAISSAPPSIPGYIQGGFGGGIYFGNQYPGPTTQGPKLVLKDTLLAFNTADPGSKSTSFQASVGGALALLGADLEARNVQFLSNRADLGAAVGAFSLFGAGTSQQLDQVDFHNNIATYCGGAIYTKDTAQIGGGYGGFNSIAVCNSGSCDALRALTAFSQGPYINTTCAVPGTVPSNGFASFGCISGTPKKDKKSGPRSSGKHKKMG